MSPISFRLTHLFYRSDCYDAAPKLLRPFYDGEIFLTVCHVKCLGLPSLCFNFFFRTTSLLSHCVLAACISYLFVEILSTRCTALAPQMRLPERR